MTPNCLKAVMNQGTGEYPSQNVYSAIAVLPAQKCLDMVIKNALKTHTEYTTAEHINVQHLDSLNFTPFGGVC